MGEGGFEPPKALPADLQFAKNTVIIAACGSLTTFLTSSGKLVHVFPLVFFCAARYNEILKKHNGMTLDVIKQVPNVLEHPIVVLNSNEYESRLVFLGEVKDKNEETVVAILELQPMNKGGEIMNMQLVASAYGKTDSPAQFIRDSGIVYIDENRKRANMWMQGLGLSLPSDTTAYGSLDKVTYPEGKVKIESVPYEKYMQTQPLKKQHCP